MLHRHPAQISIFIKYYASAVILVKNATDLFFKHWKIHKEKRLPINDRRFNKTFYIKLLLLLHRLATAAFYLFTFFDFPDFLFAALSTDIRSFFLRFTMSASHISHLLSIIYSIGDIPQWYELKDKSFKHWKMLICTHLQTQVLIPACNLSEKLSGM